MRDAERALQRLRVGLCQPHIGGTPFAPTAWNGPKHFRFGVHQHRLLLGSQYQRAPVFIGIAERGEDPLAETEIGLAVMRALDRAREGECCPAKTTSRHMYLLSRLHRALRRG